MEIHVFSDKKNIKDCFAKISTARDHSVHFFSAGSFTACLKKLQGNILVYIDFSSLEENEIKKISARISKSDKIKFGIIDPDNSVSDIAEFFHAGIVDYIGKNLYKTGLTAKHISSVYNFCGTEFTQLEPEKKTHLKKQADYIYSGDDWSLVKQGKEYTFCFMFIELDNFREMKKTAGAARAKKISDAFHNFIGNYVSSINGRIWMWMEYTGLILIPFNGKSCDAILSSFKLMLNRQLINSIELTIDYSYSYHIALHIGNTIYRERGETGTIVSDSINSIFHLGQKYAENLCFYLTDELKQYIPAGISDYFIDYGEFEGRKILRMKKML